MITFGFAFGTELQSMMPLSKVEWAIARVEQHLLGTQQSAKQDPALKGNQPAAKEQVAEAPPMLLSSDSASLSCSKRCSLRLGCLSVISWRFSEICCSLR